ncbi:MAG TPA: DUF4136 domain-containing protein [Azospirillum sp.]|nr:DUF4136 domain-containing protein [Azospirillum sp.]
MIKKTLLLLLALAVTGCGTRDIPATVTRFHRELPPGQTFTVRPQGDQRGSVEFDSYAGTVVSQMVSAGYRLAPDPGKPADLVVEFRWGVDNGRSEVVTTPLPGRDAYWQRYNCARVPYPFACEVPPISDVQAFTVFTRWLELDIIDARRPAAAPVKLFEGRAYSEGTSRQLPDVIPALVAALFTGFPGLNGETRHIAVSPTCCPRPALPK